MTIKDQEPSKKQKKSKFKVYDAEFVDVIKELNLDINMSVTQLWEHVCMLEMARLRQKKNRLILETAGAQRELQIEHLKNGNDNLEILLVAAAEEIENLKQGANND